MNGKRVCVCHSKAAFFEERQRARDSERGKTHFAGIVERAVVEMIATDQRGGRGSGLLFGAHVQFEVLEEVVRVLGGERDEDPKATRESAVDQHLGAPGDQGGPLQTRDHLAHVEVTQHLSNLIKNSMISCLPKVRDAVNELEAGQSRLG